MEKITFSADKAQSFLKTHQQTIQNLCRTSKKFTDLTLYNDLSKHIKSLCCDALNLKEVEIHYFGSRVIGLATETSDLDIFLNIDNRFFKPYDASKENHEKFQNLLESFRANDTWRVKEYLPGIVPVIKLMHLPSLLDCKSNSIVEMHAFVKLECITGDIIMTNGLATRHSKLLAHFFAIQPEAISLFHFIKTWLNIQGFNHFQGYTLTLLVVFYLQSNKLMPSVKSVQSNLPKQVIASMIHNFV